MGGGARFPLVAMISAIQKILELLIVKDQQNSPTVTLCTLSCTAYYVHCPVLRIMYPALYCVLCTLTCTAYYAHCPVLRTMNEYENCPIVCTMYTVFTAYYMHTVRAAYYMHTVLYCVLHVHCPVLRTTCTLSCTAYYM